MDQHWLRIYYLLWQCKQESAIHTGCIHTRLCDFKQCKQMYCTEELPKAKANQLLQSITLLSKKTQAWSHSARIWFAFDSHLIQSNAFESNASANANADESNANASANASAARESSASANANAAFALAFANASAFEHKPDIELCHLGVLSWKVNYLSESWNCLKRQSFVNVHFIRLTVATAPMTRASERWSDDHGYVWTVGLSHTHVIVAVFTVSLMKWTWFTKACRFKQFQDSERSERYLTFQIGTMTTDIPADIWMFSILKLKSIAILRTVAQPNVFVHWFDVISLSIVYLGAKICDIGRGDRGKLSLWVSWATHSAAFQSENAGNVVPSIWWLTYPCVIDVRGMQLFSTT